MANNEVFLGSTAAIAIKFYDSIGDPVDPTELQLDLSRSYSSIVTGPYYYDGGSGDIQRVSTGLYLFLWEIPDVLTPGIILAKWTPTGLPTDAQYTIGPDVGGYSPIYGGGDVVKVDGDIQYLTQQFFIIEELPEPGELLDVPSLYGIMRESPAYSDLGFGATDQIFLIGHGSGLTLNDPYRVESMQDAVNRLGADVESPLLKALLEVYNIGARDIWLVAAAPMSEYIPEIDDRFAPRAEWDDNNFYERYLERLHTTYAILEDYDYPEIIVALEAPFYYTGGVDFLTPLVYHCTAAFETTGKARLGIIGTRKETWIDSDITAMREDGRLSIGYGSPGKFVTVVHGEGIYSLPQMPFNYTYSYEATAAAILAISPPDRGLTYANSRMVKSLIGSTLTDEQLNSLSNVRINPIIKTTKGKRGQPYEVVLATDNTLSDEGSDYWSIVQMRLVAKVLDAIVDIGNRHVGGVQFDKFKRDVQEFMTNLVANTYIRSYTLDIRRNRYNASGRSPFEDKAQVDVSVKPYFGVRELFFTVETGLGT